MNSFDEFTSIIGDLDSCLANVMSVWNDQTAHTYAEVNENIKDFVLKILAYKEDSVIAYETVSKNYDSNEFEDELNQLGAQIMVV